MLDIKTAEGEIYYTGGDDYAQVIGEDTAVVMNHLLQNVVDNGTASKLSITTSKGKAVPLAGKTGTSSDWIDKLFVGLNPDFVSGIWIGYPLNEKIKGYNNMYTPNIWKNIIGGWIAAHYSGNDFPNSDEVVSGKYCTVTGRMAGAGCGHAKSATTGYWKKKNCPVCNGNSSVLKMVTKVDE